MNITQALSKLKINNLFIKAIFYIPTIYTLNYNYINAETIKNTIISNVDNDIYKNYIISNRKSNSSEIQNLAEYCLAYIPQASELGLDHNLNNKSINLKSNKLIFDKIHDQLIVEGNVLIKSKGLKLISNKGIIDRNNKNFIAKFPDKLQFTNEQISIKANNATFKYNQEEMVIDADKIFYQLLDRLAYGIATKIKKNENETIIYNATFSNCDPISNNNISIQSDEIKITKDNVVLKNIFIRIGDIKISYLPYYYFVVKPQTGFLIPDFSFSSIYDLVVTTPIYWRSKYNNKDFTFTPKYYLFSNGTIFNSEYRTRNKYGQTDIGLDHFPLNLARDKYINKVPSFNSDLYVVMLRNTYKYEYISLNSKFLYSNNIISYKVIPSDYFNNYDPYINNYFILQYNKENIKTNLSLYHIRSLYDNNIYSTLPEINFKYYSNFAYNKLLFDLNSQIANIVSSHNKEDDTIRISLEPKISYNFINKYIINETDIKIKYNHYYFNHNTNTSNLLPIISNVVKTTLANNIVIKNNKYRALLTYSLRTNFVLYTNNINNNSYDVTLNYNSIFDNQEYYGYDYLSSNTNVVLGIDYNLISSNSQSKFKISTYFRLNNSYKSNNEISRLLNNYNLYLKTYYKINNNIDVNINGLFNIYKLNTAFSNSNIIYKTLDDKLMFAVNHIYTNKDYVNSITNNSYKYGINQIGISSYYRFNSKIAIITSNFYDLNRNNILENYLAFTYNSCCFNFGISINRIVTPYLGKLVHNTKVSFTIGLNGLNGYQDNFSSYYQGSTLKIR